MRSPFILACLLFATPLANGRAEEPNIPPSAGLSAPTPMTTLLMNASLKLAVRSKPDRVVYAVSPLIIAAQPTNYARQRFAIVQYPKRIAGWNDKPVAELAQTMLEPAKTYLSTVGLNHTLDMVGVKSEGTSVSLLVVSPAPETVTRLKSSGASVEDLPIGSIGEFSTVKPEEYMQANVMAAQAQMASLGPENEWARLGAKYFWSEARLRFLAPDPFALRDFFEILRDNLKITGVAQMAGAVGTIEWHQSVKGSDALVISRARDVCNLAARSHIVCFEWDYTIRFSGTPDKFGQMQ